MTTWFQNFPLEDTDTAAWLDLTHRDSFRVLRPNEIPQFSPGLLARVDSVLLMRSGSAHEEFVVANLYRRDRGGVIDQMPFGSMFVSGSGNAGLLTHHGDWEQRTFPESSSPPTYFQLSALGSGVYGSGFATLGLPETESGSIFDVTPRSNIDAFQRVVSEILSQRGQDGAAAQFP
jgi:hypothetical protein